VVPGGWAIAVEAPFYLVMPLLLTRLKSLKSSLAFLVGSAILGWGLSRVALVLWTPHYSPQQHDLVRVFVGEWFFSQLPVFAVGIVVYHLFKRTQGARDRAWGAILLSGSFFLFGAFLQCSTFKYVLPSHVLYAAAFGVFAVALHFWPTRVLVNPVTCGIGKLSYSMYLTHFGAITILSMVFPRGLIPQGDSGFILAFVLVGVLSAGISVVSYRLIERPGIRLGRRLIENLEQRARTAVSGS